MTNLHYNPERFWAKVDKTGECWLWTGSLNQAGYGQFKTKSRGAWRVTGSHRVAFETVHGQIPAGVFIDHICHTPACVKPSHLRLATPKQNAENHQGPRADCKSGVRGVSWYKEGQKWRAHVGHKGDILHLGYFQTLEEAAAVVLAKRNELFTHNNIDRTAGK